MKEEEVLDAICNMDPGYMEVFIREVLGAIGFEVSDWRTEDELIIIRGTMNDEDYSMCVDRGPLTEDQLVVDIGFIRDQGRPVIVTLEKVPQEWRGGEIDFIDCMDMAKLATAYDLVPGVGTRMSTNDRMVTELEADLGEPVGMPTEVDPESDVHLPEFAKGAKAPDLDALLAAKGLEMPDEEPDLAALGVGPPPEQERQELEELRPPTWGQEDEEPVDLKDPVVLKQLFENGRELQEIGDHERALQIYESIISSDPGIMEAWLMKGDALLASERWGEAVEAYDRYLLMEPSAKEAAEAWYNKGLAFGNMAEYGIELDCYKSSIENDPEFDKAWNNMGVTLQILNRYDEGLEVYEQLLSFSPAGGLRQGHRAGAQQEGGPR